LSMRPKLPLLTATELFKEQQKGTLILDARPAEQFAALHISRSIQISLMGHFAAWAAILIDPARRLVLIAEDEQHAREAQNRLARVGIERVVGYSLADEQAWRKEGFDLASIPTHRCATVALVLQSEPSLRLVDVRSRAEWLRGHLPGAISMPLLDLETEAPCIDRSKQNLVYCHEGYRATTAASILLRETGTEVGILIDGIEGWCASGLPLEKP
jgi:rhodanese-related sulfurtransferase